MTDSINLNNVYNSPTTFFEDPEDEQSILINRNSNTAVNESQDFQLIDSINTEDCFIQDKVQESNIEKEHIKQNLKHDQIHLNNLNKQTCINTEIQTGNFIPETEKKIEKYIERSVKKKKLIEDTVLKNITIIDDKNCEMFNRKSLKRKSLVLNEESSYCKILKNDSSACERCKNKDNTKIDKSNIIFETGKIQKFQSLNANDANIKINTIEEILVDTQSESENKKFVDSKLLNQSKFSIYLKQIESLDSKVNDDIIITSNEIDKKKINFMDCNSMLSNNDLTNLTKTHKKSKLERNYPVDITTQKNIVNEKFSKITSDSNPELTNNTKEIENIHNVLFNKEDKSCSVHKRINPRMSIEVVYDKAVAKSESKDLVEINENGEEVILDFSQEEMSSKESNKVNINDFEIYENCIENSNSKNDINSKQISKELVLNILKPSKKNDFIDYISGISYNDKLVECSNQQADAQTIGEQLNSIPTLLKGRNSVVVTISDSDNSLIDDCGKNRDLNNIKLNHENVKLTQIEKEINFNVKLKCLLSIDENTKEIYQREVINISCEKNNTSHLMHPKIADSSTSTACLADISVSDNKDTSPASVNSIPQMYNLQPSRLSFVSTVSSSSSASCAVSLTARKFNKDIQFSYPQYQSKYVKKYVNHLNSENKQNSDAFEKLSKDWKNSHMIISTITNFLNNEVFILDCDNRSSDLLENSQTLRSSTPEVENRKKPVKKTTVRNIKKTKFTKQLRNSKTDNELHSLFATPLIPIKELKRTVYSSNTSTSELDNEFLGKEVFAKWSDNNYYPGKVSDIVKIKYKVNFFDGKTKLLLPDFILPIKENLEMGLSAYAYINEDKYASSVIIVDIERRNNKVIYIVETDEGKKIKTMISNIFLTSDQAKLLREQIIKKPMISSIPQQLSYVTLENILCNKRRPKRVTAIYKSKLNKSNDIFKPSVSGMQNKLQNIFYENNGKKITFNHNEEKELLEIQSEILGTVNEQTIKGPLNKVKGKNRKKLENLEDVKILGPIPEATSNIFKGMTFILSCVSPETLIRYQMLPESSESNSEPGTENEEEWVKRPFVRDHLQAQIIAGGGKIYNNFENIPPEEYPNTKHITNVPNLTKKSLLCLSVGIRSYNHQWIIRSCQQNRAIEPAEEELPAGWSLDKQAYIDTYQRPKNRPLEHTIVAIPLLEFGEKFAEFWKTICENAGASVQILKNPGDSFMEATIVLANKKCPLWVIKHANHWQIPVLSTTWVTQCLIEGKLCSSNNKKEYKCLIEIS